MIELKNIFKTYKAGTTQVNAVDGVSVTIHAGEFVAIMGASGSGKSTLMHIMGLLDRPTSGSYILGGQDITMLSDDQLAALRNRLIGFVFQQFHLLPRRSALLNAGLPLIYAGQHNQDNKVKDSLKAVGLSTRMSHKPNELSGGQQQRVAIARALVNDPFIIMADEPTGNLDTKSKDEIMGILKELHAQGKTIVMVTHEQDMAQHASRVITMRDGNIITDESRSKVGITKSNDMVDRAIKESLGVSLQSFSFGKFIDAAQQAVFAMVSNKMRSFLSILGILIGVAAVIAMLALGRGAQEAIKTQLASLGSNLLMVRAGAIKLQGVSMESGAVTRMTLADADAMKGLDGVNDVSASVNGKGQVVFENKNWSTQVEGSHVSYAKIRAMDPLDGRFFNEEEVRMRAKVAVLGLTVVREMFGEENPIGKIIKINRINFKVIGVLPPKGGNSFRDQDDTILIPVSTAMFRLLGKDYVDTIYVEAVSDEVMEDLSKRISDLLVKRHRLTNRADAQDAFAVRNMADLKATLEKTTQTMSMLLGAIAAISLMVGGIGIMNIMLVSVTERTKEIGLRKAIGATRRDIMMQFLVESVLMALIGGISGILLGAGVSFLITVLAGWTVKVAISSVVLATGFSLGVGLIFGLWPARKASRLNPIEALRFE